MISKEGEEVLFNENVVIENGGVEVWLKKINFIASQTIAQLINKGVK